MKLSYAITVCNEEKEVTELLNYIIAHRDPNHEICVLVDTPKAPKSMLDLLHTYATRDLIKLKESTFNGNFSEWKNELNEMCNGNYIFNIDADEIPTLELIQILPELVVQEVDAIAVPRSNRVEGITQDHIRKWGWKVDEEGRVNWPDYQLRLYKNSPDIKWVGKVHEKVEGIKTICFLPLQEYALYLIHNKHIDKQEKQNEFYSTIHK